MNKKKKNKQPYYPNNWQEIANCPDEWFLPVEYDEFMDWKIAGWEIPSSISCIIRETNLKTGKVSEHVYRREGNARRKATQIMDKAESEFIVATAYDLHYMHPVHLDKQEP